MSKLLFAGTGMFLTSLFIITCCFNCVVSQESILQIIVLAT